MAQCTITYSLDEIKKYWNAYTKISGMRYLVAGKWKYDFGGKIRGLISATRAEVVMLRSHMTFPTYLEKYGKDKD